MKFFWDRDHFGVEILSGFVKVQRRRRWSEYDYREGKEVERTLRRAVIASLGGHRRFVGVFWGRPWLMLWGWPGQQGVYELTRR